jgi:outer membrane receptor protein involved in Fe transport
VIDLRGLGPDRTLTLINGRRVVENDYQAIPPTMIERVEVLKDGASAVYGADAVAGVVNIITRRDFEGVEVTAQYSDHFDMDSGTQTSIGMLAGAAFDRGNVVFGIEYVDQELAYQSDAPWDFFQDAYYLYPEGCEANPSAPYPEGCWAFGSSRIPEGSFRFMTQGRFLVGEVSPEPYGVGLLQPHDGRTFNYAPINYIQTPYERTNIFAEGHFDLSDQVRFSFEIRGNFRESAQELAPLPYDSRLDPGYQGAFNGIAYTGISEDNYYLRRAIDLYNAETGANLAYEPVWDARRRMIETDRRFTQDVTQFQWGMALEGEFRDYDWEIFINHGQRSTADTSFGQFWGPNLGDALGPSADLDGDGLPECYRDVGNPGTLIPGCVPFNLFGGGEVDPVTSHPTMTTVTQDMLDYVTIDLNSAYSIEGTQAGVSVTGSNWELPGGPLGWAAGYGYWRQEMDYRPDSAIETRQATGGVYSGTSGKLTNHSVYLEFLAPLWDNGTQNFYLKGGLRYDDWDAFDGDWTWQTGLEFQLLDSLKLRGTAGTVFRIPTIWNLFGGLWDGFDIVNDPCHVQTGDPLPPGCDRIGPPPDNEFGHETYVQAGGNPKSTA